MIYLKTQLFIALIKISMVFIPQEKYLEKMDEIQTMDEKNTGFELGNWRYRTVPSSRCEYLHRFYYLPSTRPDAPVLVMVHGFMLDGRIFRDMDTLSDSVTLIAYDFPERSCMYTGSMDDFVAMLSDFIMVEHINSYSLMGVSFGSMVAMRFAARSTTAPKPQSLILLSTTVFGTTARARESHRKLYEWASALPDYKAYWLIDKILARAANDYQGVRVDEMKQMMRVKHLDFYRQVGKALLDYDASDDARAVRCPTLILHGEKDNVFTPDDMRRTKVAFPGATQRVIDNGTHAMVFLQADSIARTVRDFYHQQTVDSMASAAR